jgi:tetratricopeptide (TPR) repeat protein
MVPKKTKKKISFVWILLIVILFIIIIFTINYFSNRNNYFKGYQAYINQDCDTALVYFDKVRNGYYQDLSSDLVNECQYIKDAADSLENDDLESATKSYTFFIENYKDSNLSSIACNGLETIIKNNKATEFVSESFCESTDILLEQKCIPIPNVNLPYLYFACGQMYDQNNNPQSSFNIYKMLLERYSSSAITNDVKKALMNNSIACEEYKSLYSIANHNEFIPLLFYSCGQRYAKEGDSESAIAMFDRFLTKYPDHEIADDVESALADLIISKAKNNNAGEIPQPSYSGRSNSGTSEVIIQNDSPERLLIVFKGPETHVEILEDCSTCSNYFISPTYCPEEGPIGQYTLTPGAYEVVVMSVSDIETTPWLGSWDLSDGDEYSSCFFIITTTY